MIQVYKEFKFEAAHKLPNLPESHKCSRLHGHSYKVKVHLESVPDVNSGWFMDFDEIKAIVKPVIEQLDHYYLNDIEGLENPTAEEIARWIWLKLKPNLACLIAVELNETCTSGVIYRGQDWK